MSTIVGDRVKRAFFGSFGLRLRPIQEMAFAHLEPGQDGLIMAPTGSGKTEAALAPVAQRLLDGQQGQLRALIITPRQALGGDLHTRMAGAFNALGLRLDVATSDKNTCSTARPSDALIRTPEGLDSSLVHHAAAFAGVREVVIDEIHTFLDDPRGTQLVGLLQRLAVIAPGHRKLGASATLADPFAPERMGLLASPVHLHAPDDQGKLEVHWFDWRAQAGADGLRFVKFLRELGVKKAIGFVGARRKVEELGKLLNQGYFRDRTFVHHSGISSSGRKRTEQMLRGLPSALVVATTTLEVGIDVGSVDTCILFDAPPDTASFVQRAGRAGRRDGRRRVVCVSGLYHQRVDFARVIPAHQTLRSLDTRPFLCGCLQQAASFVAQHGRVDEEHLARFLTLAYRMEARTAGALVEPLIGSGIIARHEGQLVLGTAGEALLENRRIHLTFAPSGGSKIVDRDSGRTLGRAVADGLGELLLGGQGRQIVGFDQTSGAALTVPHKDGIARFAPSAISSFEQLARTLAGRLGGKFR